MKLTINVDPKDVLAISHGKDGKACISMMIGDNVEVFLQVEEPADEVIERLFDEEEAEE